MIKTCLINDVNIWTRLSLTGPLKTLFNHYDGAYKFWIQMKLYWNFNVDLFSVFYSVIFREWPLHLGFFDDSEPHNVRIHRDNIIHSYPPSDLFILHKYIPRSLYFIQFNYIYNKRELDSALMYAQLRNLILYLQVGCSSWLTTLASLLGKAYKSFVSAKYGSRKKCH